MFSGTSYMQFVSVDLHFFCILLQQEKQNAIQMVDYLMENNIFVDWKEAAEDKRIWWTWRRNCHKLSEWDHWKKIGNRLYAM